MGKKWPNQIVSPPKLFTLCGFLVVACIEAQTWLPLYKQALEGAMLILMGLMFIYAMNLLPDHWLEKANEGVDPIDKIPRGGKYVKGLFVALAAVLVIAGIVTIATWASRQLDLR